MRTVSVKEMKELDRRTIEEIGIPSLDLMENAGRHVAEEVCAGKKVAIFCGTGNNGGDGFVAARYLAESGVETRVYIVGKKARIRGDVRFNLERMGFEAKEIDRVIELDADLIIDAIFGIGLKGELKEPARSIVRNLNKRGIPIVSVDVPSGLDADTGEVLGEAIRATKTVTMQFAKNGFYINKGPEYVGEVVVVDIGIKA